MLIDPPTLRTPIVLAFVLAILYAVYQQIPPNTPNWVGAIAYLIMFPVGLVWIISCVGYFLFAIGYWNTMYQLGRPDVKIAEHNANLAKEIRQMNAMQMSHHLQIVNALQMPMQFQPGDVISVGGRDVQVSSLLEYISQMKPDGTMPAVRDETKNPKRDDFRHIARYLGKNGYALEAGGPGGSVKTSKELLHQAIDNA